MSRFFLIRFFLAANQSQKYLFSNSKTAEFLVYNTYMENNQPNREDVAEEFRSLGRNLVEALRSAWESPERQKLQNELEAGLSAFTTTFKEEADKFQHSPTGQQIQAELKDLHNRVQSGEAEALARREILSALRKVNAELSKVIGERQEESPASDTEEDYVDQ